MEIYNHADYRVYNNNLLFMYCVTSENNIQKLINKILYYRNTNNNIIVFRNEQFLERRNYIYSTPKVVQQLFRNQSICRLSETTEIYYSISHIFDFEK